MAPTTASRRRSGAAPYQLPSQSQPLGTWSHTSAAASSPHDPVLTLASHAIRTAFGGIVQMVADCLQCRNELSLAQIVSYLQNQHPAKTLSGRTLESTLTTRQIRAALLVLLQHSIVTVKQQRQLSQSKQTSLLLTKSIYRYNHTAAIHLLRHCRCVEYVRKAAGPDAAGVVEELLVAGRLQTLDLIVVASTAALEKQGSTATKNEETPTASVVVVEDSETNGRPNSLRNTVEALGKLVHAGFIQAVEPLTDNTEDENHGDGETEFEPARKRAKASKATTADAAVDMGSLQGDPEVVAMLLQYHSQNPTMNIPMDTVWRVNMRMFHDTLRAYHLGKLVSERHGHSVPMAGSLVTAALKYRAHVSHSPHWVSSKNMSPEQHGGRPSTVFSISDVLPYIPKSVRQVWEQKEGDVMVHWHQAWRSLSARTNPQVARRVGDDTFEIALTHLTTYLTDRILYQVVLDRHGEVAARVTSILLKHGYLESEKLAETAMVPAKDTREVLHHLFRSRYVEVVQLSSSRQYNPANAIYAWGVERTRLRRNITDDVAKALSNVRLRREHEVEVIGKNWMERAQQASDMDENDHEIDQRNYQKFCLGLERLDVAALQLDETLMALCDF
jgi:hypothetical protein